MQPVFSQHSLADIVRRDDAWALSLQLLRHSLSSGDGNEFIGNGTHLSVGRGIVRTKWYMYGSFDLIAGPYDGNRSSGIPMDYFGTGGSVWVAYSSRESDLRSAEGGYGFALGASYADISGRSVQGVTAKLSNGLTVLNYQLRLAYFALQPTLFFAWLEKPRPVGNDPKLLKTRIEGYILKVGLSLPLWSDYRAEQNILIGPEASNEELADELIRPIDDTSSNDQGLDFAPYEQIVSNRGEFSGYGVFVSLVILFGI